MKEITEEVPEKENKITYRMPIYLQLREIVRNKIEEGEYQPGTAIPSENELAETYGINRITVRNAVVALVNEGMLRRVQGKGVFVVGNKLEEALEEHGGFVSSIAKGKSSTSVKELTKVIRTAGDRYANIFEIEPEDPIFYLRQLVSVDNEPVSMEEIFVPQDVVPQLEVVNSSVFSMRDVFTFYGVEMCAMRQNLEIVMGSQAIRKMMNVPDGVALIMMECTYKDKSGRLIEYSNSYHRSDKISFKIRLHKT